MMELVFLTYEMMTLMESLFLLELPLPIDKQKQLIIKMRDIRNYAKNHSE